jgi:cation-transporting ATPase E
VTAFLVGVGLLLLLLVEPPHRSLAVIEPVSPDKRPAWLALVLAIAFVVVMAVPTFRDFFNLHPLAANEVLVVLAALAGWMVLVWIFWRGRFVDRFLGIAPASLPSAPRDVPVDAPGDASGDAPAGQGTGAA